LAILQETTQLVREVVKVNPVLQVPQEEAEAQLEQLPIWHREGRH
jgi:hypothetical protein